MRYYSRVSRFLEDIKGVSIALHGKRGIDSLPSVKILVTTVFFPPQNLIASQRPYVWARTWARLGHDVTVLTVEKDENAPDKLNKSFDGFRVVQAPVGALISRLRRHRRGPSHKPKETASLADGGGLKSRLVSWLKRKGLMSSVRLPDAFDFAVPNAWRAIPRDDYDVIVSSFGPHASLAMGYLAKRQQPSAKWVLDFRDLWVGNHVYPGIWPFSCLEKVLERFYVNRADLIVTVSEALASELRARYPHKKVIVSPNGFDPEEVATAPKLSLDFKNEHFTIVYTGSLHEEQRNPSPLFEALASLPLEVRSKLRVKFAGPIPTFLPPLVAKHGLGPIVQLLGKRSREESLRLQAEADVLLFLEKQHDEARDGVLTGKLFEYLVTGRPIWAIGVGPQSTVGKLLSGAKAGEAFGEDSLRVLQLLNDMNINSRLPGRDVDDPGDISRKFDRVALASELFKEISSI